MPPIPQQTEPPLDHALFEITEYSSTVSVGKYCKRATFTLEQGAQELDYATGTATEFLWTGDVEFGNGWVVLAERLFGRWFVRAAILEAEEE